jgi:hypothetical protein
VSIDLFEQHADEARRHLLNRVDHAIKGRAKPTAAPDFPVPARATPPVRREPSFPAEQAPSQAGRVVPTPAPSAMRQPAGAEASPQPGSTPLWAAALPIGPARATDGSQTAQPVDKLGRRYLTLAICAAVVGPPTGLPAVVFALRYRTACQRGLPRSARRSGRASLILSLFSFALMASLWPLRGNWSFPLGILSSGLCSLTLVALPAYYSRKYSDRRSLILLLLAYALVVSFYVVGVIGVIVGPTDQPG